MNDRSIYILSVIEIINWKSIDWIKWYRNDTLLNPSSYKAFWFQSCHDDLFSMILLQRCLYIWIEWYLDRVIEWVSEWSSVGLSGSYISVGEDEPLQIDCWFNASSIHMYFTLKNQNIQICSWYCSIEWIFNPTLLPSSLFSIIHPINQYPWIHVILNHIKTRHFIQNTSYLCSRILLQISRPIYTLRFTL